MTSVVLCLQTKMADLSSMKIDEPKVNWLVSVSHAENLLSEIPHQCHFHILSHVSKEKVQPLVSKVLSTFVVVSLAASRTHL